MWPSFFYRSRRLYFRGGFFACLLDTIRVEEGNGYFQMPAFLGLHARLSALGRKE